MENQTQRISSTNPSEDDYVTAILRSATSDTVGKAFSSPLNRTPKIFYRDIAGERTINSATDLIKQVKVDSEACRLAICVIENISPAYIRELGPHLLLRPSFFANHATHEDRFRFWGQMLPWSWDPRHEGVGRSSASPVHVDGMFEYHDWKRGISELTSSPNNFPRDCFEEAPYPIQSNTRISYCCPNPYLYLFLIDAPLGLKDCFKLQNSRSRTSLRVPYSCSRGGLLLPQLLSQQNYSLLETFKVIFQHTWQFHLLFNRSGDIMPPHAMLYMISNSVWETNFRFLDGHIKRISFRDLRDPKESTNDELHDLREDLEYLKSSITETLLWIPPNLSAYFEEYSTDRTHSSTLDQPTKNLRQILNDTEKLHSFLIDTFQLLMSSITVRDSKLSIKQAELSMQQALLSAEQARRSAWLTQLASLYLPLSVLTGIFGMNLREINDSNVPFWWAIVMLLILGVCTIAAYFALRGFEAWKQKRDMKRKARGKV